jgi:hypothetical protein
MDHPQEEASERGDERPMSHASGIGRGRQERARAGAAPGQRTFIVLAGVLMSLVLVAPLQTVTSKYLNDLLIFLDGAHRIAVGQVPNVDFHSSLGPLAFYIPYLGFSLSGSMSAAMPIGMALVTLATAVVAAEVIASRMRPSIGLPLALYLLLILIVPANPGEALGDISFAMFYNRIGWAALGLLLVFHLPRMPGAPSRDLVDAGCAACLVLLMLYTKITYGIVGMGFLFLLLFDRRQVRWVGLCFALLVGAVLIVEALWQGGLTHVEDLRLASQVSGSFPDIPRLTEVVARNLADIVVYGVFAVLLLALARSFRDLIFLGFCLGSGILIIEQNFQIVGILTLGAGAAVASERLLRQEFGFERQRLVAGLPLLLALLMLPVSAINLANLGMHAVLAMGGQGEQLPLPRFDGIRLVETLGPGPFGRFHGYNEAMADGRAALEALEGPVERVAVMDFANPFSAGMNLWPPRGDSPWYHWGRTIDSRHFPPAEDIFADADIILQPKMPIEPYTGDGMRVIYADYLNAHYRLIADTRDWRLYRRQK